MSYEALKNMDEKYNRLFKKLNSLIDKLNSLESGRVSDEFYDYLISELEKNESGIYINFVNLIKSITNLKKLSWSVSLKNYRYPSTSDTLIIRNDTGYFDGDTLRTPISYFIKQADFNEIYKKYDETHNNILSNIKKLESRIQNTRKDFFKYSDELDNQLIERFVKNKIEIIIMSSNIVEIVEIESGNRFFVNSDQLRDIRQIQRDYGE